MTDSTAGTTAIASIQKVGVIGGGQLAWMMAGAAQRLGIELCVQTPQSTDPAVQWVKDVILAPVDDVAGTAQLAQTSQVITFENEFVDLPGLQQLAAQGVCFRPSLNALQPLLDKYEQRQTLQQMGLPVPTFAAIAPDTDPTTIGLDFPLVVKARRHGYDGQGTFIIKTPTEYAAFWQQMKSKVAQDLGDRFMAEAFVPFERELAVIAARSLTGEIVSYPIVETQQENQVCRRVVLATDLSADVEQQCQAIAETLLQKLEVVGLFGIELFLTPTGQVLVNEVAPRTHNSGHFTLDACVTSQFEQQLRAVTGLPLGSPQLLSPGAVMVNLLGFESSSDYREQRQRLAQFPQAHVHWYGKTESRPGRKLGHVTVLLNKGDRQTGLDVAQAIESIWYGNPSPI